MNVRDALRQFIEAVDADAVRMDSNSIGEIGDAEGNYRPHQWHEEWLHHARAALAADEKDEPSLDELLVKSRDLARRIALDAEDMVNGKLKFDRQEMENELTESLVVFAHECLHADAKHAKE